MFVYGSSKILYNNKYIEIDQIYLRPVKKTLCVGNTATTNNTVK
jgi:hypothetical protein